MTRFDSTPGEGTPTPSAPALRAPELVRTTLAVLALAGLLVASVRILWPFLGAALWAAMIVVATWPLHLMVERRLGNRRGLAVATMTVILLLLLVVPLTIVIDALIDNVPRLASIARGFTTGPLPQPPAWLATVPLAGEHLSGLWRDAADSSVSELATHAAPYAGVLSRWALGQVGGLGYVLVHFLLTVAIAAVMYANGEAAAAMLRRVGRRLAGAQGEGAVMLASKAIRGVALGVGVTAIVQALLGGLGLAIAGVPFAVLCTGVMLMLCVAQIGPSPVLIGAVVWLYYSGAGGHATGLLVWSLLVISLDNVLRPMLIRRGADLPLLLIFSGVVGGLLAFGLVGIFVGPVVLAVAYTLLEAWLAEAPDLSAPPPATVAAVHSGERP